MTHVANVNKGPRTYNVISTNAVTALHLVKLGTGSDDVLIAGATDDVLGVALNDVDTVANGRVRDTVAVQPLDGSCPVQLIAHGAISVGDKLAKAAAGRVDTQATTGEGLGYIAISEATAQGDVIEAVPFNIVSELVARVYALENP